MNNTDVEKYVFQQGSQLLKASQQKHLSFFKKNWWYKKMLALVYSNHKLKTKLFHFIDVLPSLTNDQKVLECFQEYFKGHNLDFLNLNFGKLSQKFLVKNIKNQIQQVAKMFITGSDVPESLKVLKKNWENNLAFSMDILGEATLSEKEALYYSQQYLKMMSQISQQVKQWPHQKLLQKDKLGPIPACNISIKVSALFSQIKVEAWEDSKLQIKKKLRPIFQKAVKEFIFINIDMEHYEYKDLFLEIFKELLLEKDFKNYPHFGLVIQCYLKSSLKDIKDLELYAKQRGQVFTIRLVKGAYWDSEVLLAKQKDWPIPVYTCKAKTDDNFETCARWIFENSKNIKLAVGSHNIRSISYCLALHQKHSHVPLEFQVLYGMGEALAQALVDKKYCVRLYSTMGDLIPGMSYLVRRLLENSANQSFIMNSFIKEKDPEQLLQNPKLLIKNQEQNQEQTDVESFKNHPFLDFSIKHNREQFEQALEKTKKQFPINVPIILQGKKIQSNLVLKKENPNHTSCIVSNVSLAQKEHVEQAIEYSHSFFQQWRYSPAHKRIESLKKLAGLMKDEEFELASLQVLEVGKTWREAQGDVAEAIDFCMYYALQYEKLIEEQKTDDISGEDNFSFFEAIGPTACIAPWNFPLAILTGMTVAPLVCGNTVLIKPAEQSSATALRLAELLLKSGFPKESFAFLPGLGEEVGAQLVSHPKISIISFTGSYEVGAQILHKASHITKNQKDIKKCLVEMGGKNAIIVDSSADLDEAILGILHSAFGFQGQKCSACSRVIILEEVYQNFIDRFLPAVQSLKIGDSSLATTSIGPVIDQEAFNRIHQFIKQEKSQKLFQSSYQQDKPAWICPPTIYLAEQGDADIMQKELFAPCLAIFPVKSFDMAIKQLNASSFGLTAGLYSRQPSHIKKFKSLAEAGNIYINRSCTGALVKRHPFGGRKMSGLGSKTGGPDYLKQFLHTKIYTENKMRRGFSPELFNKN